MKRDVSEESFRNSQPHISSIKKIILELLRYSGALLETEVTRKGPG